MSFPRIMYHLTEGNRTDYGWGWRRVESQAELEQLVSAGWANNLAELENSNVTENDIQEKDIQEVGNPMETEIEPEQTVSVNPLPEIHKKRGRPGKKVV